MNTSNYLESLRQEVKDNQSSDNGDANTLMDIAGSEEEIAELISILKNESMSLEDRRGALNTLHVIGVFSPVLSVNRPDYVNALRGLLDSDDPELRKHAFTRLAVMKDDVAQARLRDVLIFNKNEDEQAIAPQQAIALLGYDEKALDGDLLRSIAKNPPNEACLVEAVRHMQDDDESVQILLEILQDDSKPLAARQLIPEKLGQSDPMNLLLIAQKMIRRINEMEELAPYLVSGLGTIDPMGEVDVDDIREVEEILNTIPFSIKFFLPHRLKKK